MGLFLNLRWCDEVFHRLDHIEYDGPLLHRFLVVIRHDNKQADSQSHPVRHPLNDPL